MNKKGSALIFCYLVITVLTGIGTGLVSRSITESVSANKFADSTRAFWLAESGIERSLYELNYGQGQWAGWVVNGTARKFNGSVQDGGDFTITIENTGNDINTITSTGFYPDRNTAYQTRRTVRIIARLDGNIFQFGAFGKTWVAMNGVSRTDSYDSAVGPYNQTAHGSNGDVGTNGDIDMVGTTYISGDASTGPDGEFNDAWRVSGEISHNQNRPFPVVMAPDYLSDLSSGGSITKTRTLETGTYKFDSIKLTGQQTLTINGPAEIYLTGESSIDVQTMITVNGGDVKIYADGDITLRGLGIANTSGIPSNLFLFGSGTGERDIKIEGTEQFYGAVYAPTASLTLGGTSNFYGSFIGDTVTLSGGGDIHYDEALGRVDMPLDHYMIERWQEPQDTYPLT